MSLGALCYCSFHVIKAQNLKSEQRRCESKERVRRRITCGGQQAKNKGKREIKRKHCMQLRSFYVNVSVQNFLHRETYFISFLAHVRCCCAYKMYFITLFFLHCHIHPGFSQISFFERNHASVTSQLQEK